MANASDSEQKIDKSKGGSDDDKDEDEDLDLDLEDDEDDEDDDDKSDKKDDKKEDKGSDRKNETPSQKVARLKRELKRAKAKAGEDDEDDGDKSKGSSKKDDKKSGELDYGQKAFLASSSAKISGKKELALVAEYVATGKSIDDIIENRHFLNDLKDLRETSGTKNAIPKGTRRSSNSSSDEVEYWLAKDELPPNTPENRDLRTKVVNAKMKAKQNTSMFTDQPVAGKGR